MVNPFVVLRPNQESPGELEACQMHFTPLTNLRQADVFPQGTIMWSHLGSFPYVGGIKNEFWTHMISTKEGVATLHMVDYLVWNVVVQLAISPKGDLQLKHYSGGQAMPSTYQVSNLVGAELSKCKSLPVNMRSIVEASAMGYDKMFIMVYHKNASHGSGSPVFDNRKSRSASEAARYYVGAVDLENRRLRRLPFPNVHGSGNICLPQPHYAATSRQERPDSAFQDLVETSGNMDLAQPELFRDIRFTEIEDSTDHTGYPWLRAERQGKSGPAWPTISLTLPDIWTPLADPINKFLANKNKKPVKKKSAQVAAA